MSRRGDSRGSMPIAFHVFILATLPWLGYNENGSPDLYLQLTQWGREETILKLSSYCTLTKLCILSARLHGTEVRGQEGVSR